MLHKPEAVVKCAEITENSSNSKFGVCFIRSVPSKVQRSDNKLAEVETADPGKHIFPPTLRNSSKLPTYCQIWGQNSEIRSAQSCTQRLTSCCVHCTTSGKGHWARHGARHVTATYRLTRADHVILCSSASIFAPCSPMQSPVAHLSTRDAGRALESTI
jgi:hypothetical protein